MNDRAATNPTLPALQRWMLAAITDPQGVAHALATDRTQRILPVAPQQLAQVILPGPQQTPLARLEIYHTAYFARLLEVLRGLFPCLRYAVGDDVFDAWMAEYVRACPPGSYTLARLADRLPEFLEASCPSAWGRFAVELAQLEQAIDRVFDGPGPEGLPPLILPQRPSADVRLRLAPGLELHAFRYPVSRYYSAFRQGEHPAWPAEERQWVALVRRDYIVRRYELSEPQFALLAALAGGSSLEDAMKATVAALGDALPDDLPAQVHRWFAFWASQRLFVAVEQVKREVGTNTARR